MLRKEPVRHIRNKIVYMASAFLSTSVRHGKIPQLIPMLCQWSHDDDAAVRETSLMLIQQLSTFLMDQGLKPHLAALQQALFNGMQESQPKEVQLSALQATTNLVLILNKSSRKHFVPLAEHMLQVLARMLNRNEEQSAISCIESLIEIVISKPRYFSTTAPYVVKAMLQIVKTSTFNDDMIRHTAMEWMVSLAEASASIASTVPQFEEQIIPLCMQLITTVDEEDDYWRNTWDDDDMELTSYDVGVESLDRLCVVLDGSKKIASILFSFYAQYGRDDNWKFRYACLMSVAQAAEGCVSVFHKNIQQLVDMIMALFDDSVAKVRYACIHAVAQLSSEMCPFFQETYHKSVMPALLKCMQDPVPKIQAHAATCIVNFTDNIDKELLEPYMDTLLSNLLQLLQSSRRFVQEQALTAISALVDCADHLFIKYYDHFMPFLKQILREAKQKNERLLRARAIECVSLIGVAVGKTHFSKDIQEIANLFMNIQTQAEPDDPANTHLLQSWSRIARCLQQDFVPFLPHVIPPLLKSAAIEPQVYVLDNDEEKTQDEKDCQTLTLSIKGVGEKRISIKTSDLEEQSLACNQVNNYLDLLGVRMIDYVEQIAQITVPLLQDALIDDIRISAAEIAPHLIECVIEACKESKAKPEMVKQLIDFIFESVLTISNSDGVDDATLGTVLDCLQECIKKVNGVLSQQQVANISESCFLHLKKSLIRKNRYIQQLENDEEDCFEVLQEYEEKIMAEESLESTIGDVTGSLLSSHFNLFHHIFVKQFFDIFRSMIHDQASDEDIRIALCVICDYVEFGGEEARKRFDTYAQLFFACLSHPSSPVKQPCVYGIGCMAQHSGEQFDKMVQTALQVLQKIITKKEKNALEYAPVVANAVGSFFKIIKFRSSHPNVNVNQLLGAWAKMLPVKGDWQEAQLIHGEYLNLVEQKNAAIVGGNGNQITWSNISQILNILSLIVNSKGASEEQSKQIYRILMMLQKEVPQQALEKTWGALPEKQQRKLNNAMQQFEVKQ